MDDKDRIAKEAALEERLYNVLRNEGYMTARQCALCAALIINELKKAANED